MKPLSYIAAIALSLFAVISAQGQTIKKYVGECKGPNITYPFRLIPKSAKGLPVIGGSGYYHYYEKDGKRVWHGKFHLENFNAVYEGTFTDGVPSGTWIIKNLDDSKPITYNFKEGKLDGPCKSDEVTGQFFKGKMNGHWTYSGTIGLLGLTSYKENRYYDNGVPDKEWRFDYFDKYGLTHSYRILFDKGEIVKFSEYENSSGETYLLYENINTKKNILHIDADTTVVQIGEKQYIKYQDAYLIEETKTFDKSYYNDIIYQVRNGQTLLDALHNIDRNINSVTATVYVDKTAEALEAIAAEEKQRQEEEKQRQECEALQKQLNAIRIQINDKRQAYRELYDKTYGTMSGNDFETRLNQMTNWLSCIGLRKMSRNKKGDPDVEMNLVYNNYLLQTPYEALKDKYSGSGMLKCYSNARMLLNMKPSQFDIKITPIVENIWKMKNQYSELADWISNFETEYKSVIERYYAEFTTFDQDYNEAEKIDLVVRIMNVRYPFIKKSQKIKMAKWTREQLEEYFLNLEIE